MQLVGQIRNLTYRPCVHKKPLPVYELATFDVNSAQGVGILQAEKTIMLGFSKWVTPKRTRSYPFARLYSTYHLPKRVTIIPIIKDEGMGGDNDRINFITLSWMNLSNIFIVLSEYDSARRHSSKLDKITQQKLNRDWVNACLYEVLNYQQTALHWNMMHFQRDFVQVYERAIEAYERLSHDLKVSLHASERQREVLNSFLEQGQFSLEKFRQASLPASHSAAQRERQTIHALEQLAQGEKVVFHLYNTLGGEYFLTADEFFLEDGIWVIQESKNSPNKSLPSLNDIQDGLFKLMLFVNLDELYLAGQRIAFRVRLKITGKFIGGLVLPATETAIQDFVSLNHLTIVQRTLLYLLQQEVTANKGLSVILEGRA